MFCGGFGRGFGGGGFIAGNIGFGFMSVMMLFRLLILIALIIFAVKFIKGYINHSSGALKTLDERFAKGEISEEEYMKRKTILTQRN